MRPAKSPSRACTAPTGSPPIRCSNASSSATPPPTHINADWDELPAAAADPRLGRKPGHRFRRGGGDPAELDRDPPLHVELCRHRPHHQAARARRSTGSSCCSEEVEDYYGHFRVTPDLVELRNLLAERRADRPLRARTARKAAGCTTRSIIPKTLAEGGGYGAGALASRETRRSFAAEPRRLIEHDHVAAAVDADEPAHSRALA